MGYSTADLSLLEPLTNPEEREGTSYFEFHPKELPYEYACWLDGSLLLKDAAFDFFAECFYSASNTFDYFSFQRFDEAEIASLLNEIDLFLKELDGATAREQVFSRYDSLFTTEIWSALETHTLASAVRKCGEELRSFITSKTQDSKCLWILGM